MPRTTKHKLATDSITTNLLTSRLYLYPNSTQIAWCLWIAVDHTYNCIPGLIGSHELLCTVFRANMTMHPRLISFQPNMRSLASVAGYFSKVELPSWCLRLAIDHTYYPIPGVMGLHNLLCSVCRAFTLQISA